MTDRHRLCPGAFDEEAARRCLLVQAQHAVQAGVDLIQIRERGLEDRHLLDIVREIVRLASGTPTKVIVNDRLDVALAGGAGGVHLRSRSVSAGVVRSVAPRDFLIGRSVHSIDEAVAAAPDVDYLIAGAVWPSRSKPAGHAVLGIAGLAAVAAAVSVPVLAIGGVTLEHLPQLRTSGAAGAAAIGLFMTSADESAADGCRACPLETVVASARAV